MSRQVIVALLTGILFGAWDPTLAVVMGSALLPMSIASHLQRKMTRPIAAADFVVPATQRIV